MNIEKQIEAPRCPSCHRYYIRNFKEPYVYLPCGETRCGDCWYIHEKRCNKCSTAPNSKIIRNNTIYEHLPNRPAKVLTLQNAQHAKVQGSQNSGNEYDVRIVFDDPYEGVWEPMEACAILKKTIKAFNEYLPIDMDIKKETEEAEEVKHEILIPKPQKIRTSPHVEGNKMVPEGSDSLENKIRQHFYPASWQKINKGERIIMLSEPEWDKMISLLWKSFGYKENKSENWIQMFARKDSDVDSSDTSEFH